MRSLARRTAPVPPDDSFTAFCAAHTPTVIRILGKIGVHEADIQDIAQHVFLKIHKTWDKSPIHDPGAWLVTICRQQAAEHYRLYRNRFERPEPNVGAEMTSNDDDAQTQLEHYERDQMVQRVLATMDPQLRDVLERHEIHEESLETIAKAHDIVRNTAYARLAEAKKSFRLRAERMLGEKRTQMLLFPFGMETIFADRHLSAAFVEDVHRKVWQGLTRQLGLAESNPPAAAMQDLEETEPPESGARRILGAAVPPRSNGWLRVLRHPLFWLPTGVFAGIAGAMLWPHDTPLIARHTPAMFGPVIVFGRDTGNETALTFAPPTPNPTPNAANQKIVVQAPPTPLIDNELSMLAHARSLLENLAFTEALTLLRQHERTFPQSEEAETRKRYIAIALRGQKTP